MRKAMITLILISISTFLFSCVNVNTDTDFTGFEDHLIEYQDIYLERIDVFNQLSNQEIKSVVKVIKNGTRLTGTQSGSGVIFKQSEKDYYLLTNHHVIDDPFMHRTSYQIIDFKGDTYVGYLIAKDPDYDLAVLRFTYVGTDLHVAQFASSNPEKGSFVAVIGYPEGHINAMTFGTAIDYDQIIINDNEDKAFNFESLITNVPVKSGSSGAPVFDTHGHIIGLVYAASIQTNSTVSRYMYAIPVLSIFEFLQTFGLMEVST